MKTRIKKIIVMTVALLFLGVGVSFAHDWNRGYHKSPRHAYGHYKKGHDYHPGKYERHFYGNRHPWYSPRHHYKKHYNHRENYKHRHHPRNKRHSSQIIYYFSF